MECARVRRRRAKGVPKEKRGGTVRAIWQNSHPKKKKKSVRGKFAGMVRQAAVLTFARGGRDDGGPRRPEAALRKSSSQPRGGEAPLLCLVPAETSECRPTSTLHTPTPPPPLLPPSSVSSPHSPARIFTQSHGAGRLP